ncbi:hypothetical protein [Streptomyces sp. MBT53]|uniref:hypothetical protein n=1 Tax=Streptomyces sp. MBT53 TaxID=1488384 RepID=UPI0019148F78|nr:hypothetical protein [Streptomyces sp. MBT53]MBK6017085.1 hypothetical protein [Streptomyces sp. MBT53]
MIDRETCMSRLAELDLLPDDTVAVLCVGSVARGWSNDTSDLNFYVVSLSPWQREGMAFKTAPLDHPVVPVHVLRVDGRTWKLKHWTVGQADQMLAKVGHDRFDGHSGQPADLVAPVLAEIEELFVERLESAVPVLGDEWLAAYRETARRSAFRDFLTERSAAAFHGHAEAAKDRMSADDTAGAVLCARQAFGFAVDAFLDSRGNHGNFTPKWRARRFMETGSESLSFEDYWAFETMHGFDSVAPESWVRRVLAAGEELLAETRGTRSGSLQPT